MTDLSTVEAVPFTPAPFDDPMFQLPDGTLTHFGAAMYAYAAAYNAVYTEPVGRSFDQVLRDRAEAAEALALRLLVNHYALIDAVDAARDASGWTFPKFA